MPSEHLLIKTGSCTQSIWSPLEVQVVPAVQTIDVGKNAEFTCWTNIDEAETGSRQMVWKKDGVEIHSSLRTSFSSTRQKFHIASVQAEDKGMYQCFVQTATSQMAQGSAQLRLGGEQFHCECIQHCIWKF